MTENTPRGILMNRTELSNAFGIAKTTIDKWVHAGMPVFKKAECRGKASQFDTANCIDWIRMHRCSCRYKRGLW